MISVHLTSCLIHTTLCKISVYMHRSPCPWGLHRCSSSNVHPLCGVCGFSRFTCHSHFFPPPLMDFIVLPHLKYLCLTLLLLFSFLFSSPRGAGGGDGESRDAGSPGETETPAQTQRALPFSPAGVFTSHTHQVHFICVTGLDALFTFFLWDLLVQLLNPPTYLTFYFGFKYPSHAVTEVLFTKCFFIFSSKSFGLQLIQQTQLFLQTEHF